jgi:hypothetical protein
MISQEGVTETWRGGAATWCDDGKRGFGGRRVLKHWPDSTLPAKFFGKYYALLRSGATQSFKKVSRRCRMLRHFHNQQIHQNTIIIDIAFLCPLFETMNTPAINMVMSFTMVIVLSLE